MSDKLKQIDRVLYDLKKDGKISRNYYIDLPFDKILRLGAIIFRLRQQGYDITTTETERDTFYILKEKRVESFNIVYPDGHKELVNKKVYV